MIVLVPGHKYEIPNDEDRTSGQILQFVHREALTPDSSYPPSTLSDGCTAADVLAVLLNKLQYTQFKSSSKELACAITKLEEAQLWLEKRERLELAKYAKQTEGN